MDFLKQQGPHWHTGASVARLMRQVIVALAPVIAISTWYFGASVLINAIACIGFCLGFEWLALRIRNKPPGAFLSDGSAVVTGLLLALALPPLLPWWLLAIGCFFAVVVAKHLYGGLGYNVFNPAMVGYVVLLVAFPAELAIWPALESAPGIGAALAAFGGITAASGADILTAATPLDTVKIELNQMRTMSEIFTLPAMTGQSASAWIWINVAALAGGIAMLAQRTIRWHIPISMLAALAGLTFLFYAFDPATHPSPVFELLSGGTMLGAFFIATDPVSGATTERGRLFYGAGIGVLCFALRRWGSHPDGIAFAILLMNMAVPLIDRFTVPRIYGHRKP
jgi:electron transport complex protein RnfD